MRRKKWGDKKKIMKWRVWKKEMVVSLWLHILLGLKLDNVTLLMNIIFSLLCD